MNLRIYGIPAPQGSKTAVSRGGRAWVIEGGSQTGRNRHRAWRDAVQAAAFQTGHKFDEDTPLGVDVDFAMPRPKSRRKAHWCSVKPDVDKLLRALLDGLSDGGLFAHDQRVVEVRASKFYETEHQAPGAVVSVYQVGDN